MKQRPIYLLFFILTCLYLVLLGNSSGSPAQSTGAPGETTCGRSGCHSVVENIGAATLSIAYGTGVASYSPNEVYPITIALSNGQNMGINGFQIVALDTMDNNVGSWELTDSANTQIFLGNFLSDRSYATHTKQGSNLSSWSVNWKAPAEMVGPVTFYAAGNDADGNGARTGDAIYFTNLSISEEIGTTSVRTHSEVLFNIYPNPTSDYIYIAPSSLEITNARLYNANGQLILTTATTSRIDVSTYEGGLYLLELQTPQGSVVKKILLQD